MIECIAVVKDGDLWCITHDDSLPLDLGNHDGHTIQALTLIHAYYTAHYCLTCDSGLVIVRALPDV